MPAKSCRPSSSRRLRHPNFELHIEEAADVCTSTLVDRHLAGRHRAWAIVAPFGDHLPEVGAAKDRRLNRASLIVVG